MAKFQVNAYPHLHSGRSTHKYMLDLPLTTYPMAIVAMLFQFLYVTMYLDATFTEGIVVAIRAGLVIFTGVFSCIAAESIWNRYVLKEYDDFAGWFRSMATSYPSITGMLYALSLPFGTPLYVVIIGGFVAIIIGKSIFGGVGNNIFNPALVGRAFITIAFTSLMQQALNYQAIPFTFNLSSIIFGINPEISSTVDAISSASPLTIAAKEGLISYATIKEIYGSFLRIFLGFYPSALGESLSFWIILAFIYLSIKKTINWFVPVIYVGLVFLMTWAVALLNQDVIQWTTLSEGLSLNTFGIYFPLFYVLTGGLLFGAVFMATEPVTQPITKKGRVIFAIYLAIITFVIRMLGNLPEGVLFSILFMNMFTPIIDNALMGQRKGISKKEILFWIITGLIIVGITYYTSIRLGGAL
ncbi:MAG TPA: RnfABCDGE type electron transport complex subunit D [Haloplasmataceae bacterium]